MEKQTNLTPQPSYRVEIKQNEQKISIAENIPQMDHAVEFALRLHQSSNKDHIIHVIHDDIIDCTFVRYATAKL